MPGFFGTLLSRLSGSRRASATTRVGRVRPAPTKASFRPTLEILEDRWVPSNTGSISGHIYLDATGNGLQPADQGQSNVTVKLYADPNHSSVLGSGDPLAATVVSGADGSFSFTGLTAGEYFVKETVPSGYVRTAPTSGSYYTVNLADGQAVTGENFSNFQKLNTSLVTNISFTVTSPDGTQTVVNNLRGHTQQGDTVTANFTIVGTSGVVVSLISYDAPGASFDANTASEQVPIQIATGTFQPGPGSLTVTIPNNFYQVDFVMGSAIDQLGPAGSNLFYSAQDRLLSADNNGTQAAAPTLSGYLLGPTGLPPTPGSSVVVTLTGVDASGNQVSQETAMVDTATGFYSFTGLQPGVNYTLTVTDSSGIYASETQNIMTNGSSISDDIVTLALQQSSTGGGGGKGGS